MTRIVAAKSNSAPMATVATIKRSLKYYFLHRVNQLVTRKHRQIASLDETTRVIAVALAQGARCPKSEDYFTLNFMSQSLIAALLELFRPVLHFPKCLELLLCQSYSLTLDFQLLLPEAPTTTTMFVQIIIQLCRRLFLLKILSNVAIKYIFVETPDY